MPVSISRLFLPVARIGRLVIGLGLAFAVTQSSARAQETGYGGAAQTGAREAMRSNGRSDAAIVEAFSGAADERTIEVDDEAYAAFLQSYVVERPEALNIVRYEAVSEADHRALEDQIDRWQAVDWRKLTRDQKFAFFANLYNAVTLDVVLDHYPVDSIRDIRIEEEDQGFFAQLGSAFDIGPWSAPLVTIDGEALSLDQIEHSILRPMGDNRVHYAVNCASIGCPDLRPEPWSAAGLDGDLDAAASEFLATPRGLQAASGGGVEVSRIYDWFVVDFGGDVAGVLDHLRRYAPQSKQSLLSGTDTIAGYRYDWSLNGPSATGS